MTPGAALQRVLRARDNDQALRRSPQAALRAGFQPAEGHGDKPCRVHMTSRNVELAIDGLIHPAGFPSPVLAACGRARAR